VICFYHLPNPDVYALATMGLSRTGIAQSLPLHTVAWLLYICIEFALSFKSSSPIDPSSPFSRHFLHSLSSVYIRSSDYSSSACTSYPLLRRSLASVYSSRVSQLHLILALLLARDVPILLLIELVGETTIFQQTTTMTALTLGLLWR
jgi:hypothetical protein